MKFSEIFKIEDCYFPLGSTDFLDIKIRDKKSGKLYEGVLEVREFVKDKDGEKKE